jgi:CHAD domain-containing protein
MAETESTETRQFAIEQSDKLLGQLAFQISRTLRSHDSQSIHELRVAIRRFRQALHVFKPCFPSKDVEKIRRQLDEIMVPAREVRDCELALGLLPKSADDGLAAELGRQRIIADRTLRTLLTRWMHRKSSLKWRTRLQGAVAMKKSFPQTAEEVAAGMLPDLAKAFFDRGNRAAQVESSADELHRFRISAKKFRYTLELFTTLYGPDLCAWLEQIRSVHALAGAATGPAPERKQRKMLQDFRREWTKVFAGPDTARYWINHLRHFAGKQQTQRKPIGRSDSAHFARASHRA